MCIRENPISSICGHALLNGWKPEHAPYWDQQTATNPPTTLLRPCYEHMFERPCKKTFWRNAMIAQCCYACKGEAALEPPQPPPSLRDIKLRSVSPGTPVIEEDKAAEREFQDRVEAHAGSGGAVNGSEWQLADCNPFETDKKKGKAPMSSV